MADDLSGGLASVNPVLLAADNHNVAGQGTSWFQDFGNAITYGSAGAVTSAITSVLNTGIAIADWAGADIGQINNEKLLRSFDDDLGKYYAQHQEGIDTVGFLGGSLVPGMLGIKALKMVQGANYGKNGAASLGLFVNNQTKYLEAAKAEITAGNVYTGIASNRNLAILNGVADQALQTAAFETMVAATMYKSPTFDKMSLSDLAIDMAFGAGVGGVIGGAFEAAGVFGKLSKFRAQTDLANMGHAYRAAVGEVGVAAADQAAFIIESMARVETTGTPKQMEIAAKTLKDQDIQARILMAEAFGGDSALANRFVDATLEARKANLANPGAGMYGSDPISDFWVGLRKGSRIDETASFDPEIVYFYGAKGQKAGEPPIIASRVPPPDTHVQPAYHVDPATPIKMGSFQLYTREADAFADGMDLYMNSRLRVSVNPNSTTVATTARPGNQARVFMNLRTAAVTDSAYPVIGDFVHNPQDLKIYNDRIEIAKTQGESGIETKSWQQTFNTGSGVAVPDSMSSLEANAAYVWAAKVDLPRSGLVVDTANLPMLERITNLGEQDMRQLAGVKIRNADGTVWDATTVDAGYLKSLLQEQKVAGDLALLKSGIVDARDRAIRLNVPEEFLASGHTGEFRIAADQHMVPNTVALRYDISQPLKDIDGFVARGYAWLEQKIKVAQDTADAIFLNFAKDKEVLFPKIDTATVKRINATGEAGAGAFSSVNANYGSAGADFQRVGTSTKGMQDERISALHTSLTPAAQALINKPTVAAEVGMMLNNLRRTSEKFVLSPDGSGIMLKSLARAEAAGEEGLAGWMVPEGFTHGAADTAAAIASGQRTLFTRYQLSPDAVAWWQASHSAHQARLQYMNQARVGMGFKPYDTEALYAPPINTAKQNYIAMMVQRGVVGGEKLAITARTEQELEMLMSKIPKDQYDVYTKGDIKNYKQMLGEYQYEMSWNTQRVNSEMEKRGVLANYYPETDPTKLLAEFVDWHVAQESKLVRDMVSYKYAQPFAEVEAMAAELTNRAASVAKGAGTRFEQEIANPYQDYVRTALNISRKSEYPIWSWAQEKAEVLFTGAFNAARSAFVDAAAGKVSFEEANQIAANAGLGRVYGVAATHVFNDLLKIPVASNQLSKFVSTSNSILAATTLRLDTMNAVVNTISTPIALGAELASIRNNITKPEVVGELNRLTQMSVPGSSVTVPSTGKLIFQAVRDFVEDGGNGSVLLKRYQDMGVVGSELQHQHNMINDLSLTGSETLKMLTEKANKWVEKGASLTLNNQAEQFTRFVSARVMHILTDTAQLSEREANAYITTFVNRVQGNYIASQRPVAFLGPVGQAISLFQTYQFNLMQQLFRHAANGDTKTIAILAGLQSSLYGLQGLPAFNAINTHIVGNAAGNPEHKDLNYLVPATIGKDLGDWLMYGTASAFPLWSEHTPALYSRGDINPRQLTVLPTNWQDIPAVSASMRLLSSTWNMTQKMTNGGAVWDSFTQGLEHQGLSRPLAGLAQLAQGYTTTSQGSLIAAIDRYSIANAGRVLGAKPFDEALALDAKFRSTAYRAKDLARIEGLGEAIKTRLMNNESPTGEEMENFAARYAAAGGRIEEFNKFVVRNMKNANTSIVNQMKDHLNSPLSRNMQVIMGGDPLPDFTNQPAKQGFQLP